jgi:arylsulfatase A-like enzyme
MRLHARSLPHARSFIALATFAVSSALALSPALAALAAPAAGPAPSAAASKPAPHNVILFVPDGLRSVIVDATTAPAFDRVQRFGVRFTNSHSLFPTFTTPNASALATGHYLGDTGDFSNTIYAGFPVPGAGGSVTPFIESDTVLGDIDDHFAGNFLDETTLLAAARGAGYSTAAVGKLGPALIFDPTERTGAQTIVIDDWTGNAPGLTAGIPLDPAVATALQNAGLGLAAPSRGENGKAGDASTPGTHEANIAQQDYFVDAVTKVILPQFKTRKKPFVLVFWSRDPDGSQHNQGDSLNTFVPGINGPTSLAAIKNANDDLERILAALAQLGLRDTTDIVVSADHGFSTISKQSATSPAAAAKFKDVPNGSLPPGFLALDLATALHLPLFDPDKNDVAVDPAAGQHPSRGNGLIGLDSSKPDVVVAANGGSDLVYLPQANAREFAPRAIEALLAQDYVSGLFVDESLGSYPGTLPLGAVNLKGSALTPVPAIVVNFKSFAAGCSPASLRCAVEVADTGLQQGQGMHGSFGRSDTKNFTAAIGPDFKKGYADGLPVSNADIGKTLAAILGLDIRNHGKLVGRVIAEALPNGPIPRAVKKSIRSLPAANGLVTELRYQQVGETRYFDAAGFPGRTLGL